MRIVTDGEILGIDFEPNLLHKKMRRKNTEQSTNDLDKKNKDGNK